MSDYESGRRAVISRYEVPALRQQDLEAIVSQALRDWICKRPGFVSGAVHCSMDQHHLVTYTLWAREHDAIHYMQCVEGTAFMKALRSSGADVRDSHVYRIGETAEPMTS